MSLSKLCFSCDLYLGKECFNDEEYEKGCMVRQCNRHIHSVDDFRNDSGRRRYDLQRAHEEGYYCNDTKNCNCNCCPSVGELKEQNIIERIPDFIGKYENEVNDNMIYNECTGLHYLDLHHKRFYEYLMEIRKIRKKGILDETTCQILDSHFPNDDNIWVKGDRRLWIKSIKLYLERSHNLENIGVDVMF